MNRITKDQPLHVSQHSSNEMLPAVAWEEIGKQKDDFVFRYGDYCLRVEQMNKKYWWWCVYYKDGYADFDNPSARTELEAKLLAELSFIRHLSSHSS